MHILDDVPGLLRVTIFDLYINELVQHLNIRLKDLLASLFQKCEDFLPELLIISEVAASIKNNMPEHSEAIFVTHAFLVASFDQALE